MKFTIGMAFIFLSLFYSIGLAILFFSKKHVKNYETRLFSVFLPANLIGLVVELLCSLSIGFLGSGSFTSILLTKLYLVYLIFFGLFFISRKYWRNINNIGFIFWFHHFFEIYYLNIFKFDDAILISSKKKNFLRIPKDWNWEVLSEGCDCTGSWNSCPSGNGAFISAEGTEEVALVPVGVQRPVRRELFSSGCKHDGRDVHCQCGPFLCFF